MMNFQLCVGAALALGCAGAMAASPASAQPVGAPWPFEAAGPGSADRPEPGRPPVCAQWCFEDYTPCDPPVFKRADGRCETRNYGRR